VELKRNNFRKNYKGFSKRGGGGDQNKIGSKYLKMNEKVD
jgi:hypothetical protein